MNSKDTTAGGGKSSTSPNWHAETVEATLQALESSPAGLDETTAQQRLERYGLNKLAEPRRHGPLIRFLLHFNNVLIYILLVAGITKALLQQWVDAGVIFGVVCINALIGFFQEGRAEKAIDAIRGMMSLKATVRRGGHRREIDTAELVPGDIVLLGSGDRVPADLRLIESRELRIDEAMLTGESVPAEKGIQPVAASAAMGDRRCLAFSGTLVTSGRGLGVVIATGQETGLGQISDMVTETEAISTPLIRKVNHFAHRLAMVIAVVSGLTFGLGYLIGGRDVIELLFASIALAVAAIPEGLPAIMTIVLAIGVRRMASRNALIRRLQAVDTLGALTVICSDKTGTLTRNEMTVQFIALAEGSCELSGTGYAPRGEIRLDDQPVDAADYPALQTLLRAAALCNESELKEGDGGWQTHGDPMEGALLAAAGKGGLDFRQLHRDWPAIDTIPFESEHRFMATLHAIPTGQSIESVSQPRILFIKGAPERILDYCGRQLAGGELQPLDATTWHEREEQLANQGQRVLALAMKPVDASVDRLDFDSVQRDLCLLGLVGIIDPPRDEAIESVAKCQSAGIRVVMITGDHLLTAKAIGKQLHIGDGRLAISGAELEELSDEGLREIARDYDVFARVSPEHKLRLVKAIQASGEVVAMTGDGVNDAPALKRADVGIAMGVKGTEVTKEAAEMVLADDNFASIERAVEEGRTVFDNLRKSLLFLLPINGGEGSTIFLAILLGRTLPLTPVQVLWVNMVSSITLAMALAFEPPESKVMQRPPRKPESSLLSSYFLWRILFVSSIICAGVFGVFIGSADSGLTQEQRRTLAVNTIVLFEAYYLLSCRFLTAPVLSLKGLTGNRAVWISIGLAISLQLIFTYLPVMQTIMGSQAISLTTWLPAILIASSVLWLVECEKWIVKRFFARRR